MGCCVSYGKETESAWDGDGDGVGDEDGDVAGVGDGRWR